MDPCPPVAGPPGGGGGGAGRRYWPALLDLDLMGEGAAVGDGDLLEAEHLGEVEEGVDVLHAELGEHRQQAGDRGHLGEDRSGAVEGVDAAVHRSEEHTSELQSLMRHSYAVFGL